MQDNSPAHQGINSSSQSLKLKNSVQQIIYQPLFKYIYLCVATAILLGTTIYWAILGGKVNLSNADNLVSAYLFQSSKTFHQATFPAQHSFLFKWPLFWLLKLFGYSETAFVTLTVVVVVLTILGFAFVLSRIERRPLFLGTLFLIMASVLLLVPAEPYKQAFLPVNMAMLTTRNLEYIIYIAGLIFIGKSQRFKSWTFGFGVICLAILDASDKLFVYMGFGAALLALVIYALVRKWQSIELAVNWLMAEAIAAVIAFAILGIIGTSGFTHITSQAVSGPYGTTTAHGILLGSIYSPLNILTNLGANPAYDVTILHQIPSAIIHRLASTSISDPAFVINFIVAIAGCWLVIRALLQSTTNKNTPKLSTTSNYLVLMLSWSSVAGVLLYIFSNHYYAEDGRYIGIIFFSVFVAAAAFTRSRWWSETKLLGIASIAIIGIAGGVVSSHDSYYIEDTSLSVMNSRNELASAILNNHPVDVLVGDYWRVVPVKQQSASQINVMPLISCTEPQTDLSSATWQPNLHKSSFAYLISYDQHLTSFPNCSIDQVVAAYGRPNESELIAGSLAKPQEQLLFYDRGINNSSPATPPPPLGLSSTSTILPITIDELPYTFCKNPTLMAFVAHQDDDLLFMNPDVMNTINASYCTRIVYLTAGDAGDPRSAYWQGRRLGSEAAYSKMLGNNTVWINRILTLAPNEYIVVANPRGDSMHSLIFLNLPDGNVKGQGFPITNYESLAKLYASKISTIHSVDGQSSYTLNQLTDALALLLTTYSPAEIYTQSTYPGKTYPDHSDHNTVGQLVKRAYTQYEQQGLNNLYNIPIHYYMGYTIHERPQNLSSADIKSKEAVFFIYAQHDNGVCSSEANCSKTAYQYYLNREYQNSY